MKVAGRWDEKITWGMVCLFACVGLGSDVVLPRSKSVLIKELLGSILQVFIKYVHHWE